MQRRHFLSAFTLSAFTGAAGGALIARPEAAQAMSMDAIAGDPRIGVVVPEDALDWRQLNDLDAPQLIEGRLTRFAPETLKLDGRSVTLYGYMMPFREAAAHGEFLLGDKQFHCPTCLMMDAPRLVNVRARRAIPYSDQPVKLVGRLDLIEDEGSMLRYRLNGARPA